MVIFSPFKKISTILQSYQHYILKRSFSKRGGGKGRGLPQIITREAKAVLNRLNPLPF